MKILEEFIAELKKFGIKKAAALCDIPAGTIYQWTAGNRIPTLVNAQKVANAMGLEFLIFNME